MHFKSAVVGEAGHFSAWFCKAEYRALIQDLIIPLINIQQLVTINRQSTFQSKLISGYMYEQT